MGHTDFPIRFKSRPVPRSNQHFTLFFLFIVTECLIYPDQVTIVKSNPS
ncbi:hypothetical protein AALP_AA8G182700 [Arabis alpina]|uniref:Uncharacterized protein n=1 Tax=Arabis alpina TaxID=50452 RepID=A0A087G7T8_ARAAL|nr:hypothetical protein AALP_AA8G182700 [Arabis alpina]